MHAVDATIDCLERTPTILNHLLEQIPPERFRLRRISDKWSIHEQVCHLVEAQGILSGRFTQFEEFPDPLIELYNPPVERPKDYLLSLDMDAELLRFSKIRAGMVSRLRGFPRDYWERQGRHAGFEPYNTRLLLTHALNVDYAHLFSIEQLGLTKPEFEDEIITIP